MAFTVTASASRKRSAACSRSFAKRSFSRGSGVARQLTDAVDALVKVIDGTSGLRVGGERAEDGAAVEAGTACERLGRFLPRLAERAEDLLLGDRVHVSSRRHQVEVALARPVVARPAREAEREAHVAEVGEVE